MGCDVRSKSLDGQSSLLAGGGGLILCYRPEVDERTLRTPEVTRCRVEDGIFLGKTRSPAARVVELALAGLWSLEDGTGKGG